MSDTFLVKLTAFQSGLFGTYHSVYSDNHSWLEVSCVVGNVSREHLQIYFKCKKFDCFYIVKSNILTNIMVYWTTTFFFLIIIFLYNIKMTGLCTLISTTVKDHCVMWIQRYFTNIYCSSSLTDVRQCCRFSVAGLDLCLPNHFNILFHLLHIPRRQTAFPNSSCLLSLQEAQQFF